MQGFDWLGMVLVCGSDIAMSFRSQIIIAALLVSVANPGHGQHGAVCLACYFRQGYPLPWRRNVRVHAGLRKAQA